MTWRDEAINKLKAYQAKCIALENLPDDIQEQEEKLSSIRSVAPDSETVAGSGLSREDRMLNILTYREELEEALHQTTRWVKKMDKALSVLNEEEYRLLDQFYIHPIKNKAERLAEELAVSPKTVYSRKDKALVKFTMARCGALET